jgi:nitrilase
MAPQTVRVAAVQAAPVYLDRDATIEKAVALIDEAAALGAQLIVFGEVFVPGYPDWTWRTSPWRDATLFARLLDQAVVVPSPATERLGEAARRANATVVIGIDERDAHGSTIYNSLLYLGSDGSVLGVHRKLMPTGGERLVWGYGDGSDLGAHETSAGRVGGLICWENYMPLARAAVYSQGLDIYLAPTWDNSDSWVSTLRHIAKEGRVYVVGVTPCQRGSDVRDAFDGLDALYGGDDDWLSRGNTTIVGPDGDIIAGPLIGEPGILTADLDLDVVRAERRRFDPVGHYARSDVFRLVVDDRPKRAVSFESDVAHSSEPPGE